MQTFNTITNSTSEVVAKPAETVEQEITDIIVDNPSATPTSLIIKDGAGGPTICRIPAPDDSGAIISLKRPLRVRANNAIILQCADAVTSLHVTLTGRPK